MADLTDAEKAVLAELLRHNIERSRFPRGQLARSWRAILAKLEPHRPPPAAATPAKRCVILHYHLFKNAGSSVDTILRDNFGSGWATREFAQQQVRVKAEAVRDLLIGHPEIRALSSHTMRLPPPAIPGVDVFPIIFVRHPIDRIRSGYGFERSLPAESGGARIAHEKDFAGYVRARLALPEDRFCRNAQTWRLAMAERADAGSELARALRCAEQLPFVGGVEAFDASMQALERLLEPRFPGFRTFPAFTNVLRAGQSLGERLAEIRRELGNLLYEELAAANADDLSLHGKVLARYAKT